MTETKAVERSALPDSSGPMPIPALAALGAVLGVVAWTSIVGSDALWLSALGDTIRADGTIPSGVPFAAAPSGDWVNTTALGQVVFSLLHIGGSLGVVAGHVAAVAWTLWILASSAKKRGASNLGLISTLVLILAGGVAPLLIARAQMLSFVPYAALLVLIRREQERPSRFIWAAVPLIVLWGNLHGAVLVGVAVLGCYLAFSRLRLDPWTSVGVGVASLAATCLNPGLLRAPHYYLGVFGGAATDDASGMWSRISMSNPFDLMLMVATICLAYMTFRSRRPVWEYAAALGLTGATVVAARHGVWLLLFLGVPAALTLTRRGQGAATPGPPPSRRRSAATALTCFVVVAGLLMVRVPTFSAGDAEAARLADSTRGQVVLVAEPLAESLAAAGARVWVSNPLDAFNHADQTAYLGFMAGDAVEGARALAQADVVVAMPSSPQARAAQTNGYTAREQVGLYWLLRKN